MELVISIIFLLYNMGSFTSEPQTTTMEISINDCRTEFYPSRIMADSIAIYKLPENQLIQKVRTGRQDRLDKQPVKIENLIVGKYKIVFRNKYRQVLTQEVTLTGQPVNAVTLCIDKLLSHPVNTLAKLQDKDTISINFSSVGCFHAYAKKIVIAKEAGRFIAKFYELSDLMRLDTDTTPKQFSASIPVKMVYMTQQHIEDFIRFENELGYPKNDGCTGTDIYEIKSKYLNVKKEDGSCDWNGFYYLGTSLFGKIY